MKACSFLPAATSVIRELGLEEHLCSVTFECPVDKPRVVRSHLEGQTNSSEEIQRIVSEAVRDGAASTTSTWTCCGSSGRM